MHLSPAVSLNMRNTLTSNRFQAAAEVRSSSFLFCAFAGCSSCLSFFHNIKARHTRTGGFLPVIKPRVPRFLLRRLSLYQPTPRFFDIPWEWRTEVAVFFPFFPFSFASAGGTTSLAWKLPFAHRSLPIPARHCFTDLAFSFFSSRSQADPTLSAV